MARFRGIRELEERHLRRFGRRLALASLRIDGAALVDLDDPAVLERQELRPSQVATGKRAVTQRQAAALYELPAKPAGLRWWSSLEASWLNVTLFDRALSYVDPVRVDVLELASPDVRDAAEFLGFRG